ncbi:MAG: hypothetical protein CVV16_03920 [Gammaproteobacteria bacterium HGW-Gammaproteobacteria-6]|nr:MAG: hypothetical protein CVV16_03920 [Gammaproteobacteria bacterium HGW-Gammaproteobacteria-6]
MLTKKTLLHRFALALSLCLPALTLTGCMTGSYFESSPIPVLDQPPSTDYRSLGTTQTYIDMRVGSATWRSIVDYRLASQAVSEYGSEADAVIMLNYNEGPQHAIGVGMVISYVAGQSGAQTTPVVKQPQAIPTPLNLPTGEVILYRDKRALNSDVDYIVHWQGKPQGVVRNGGALRVRLPAGPQVLNISYRPGAPEFQEQLVVSEDSEAYLFMRLNYSLSARSHLTIEPVPVEQGRAAVMALQN